jgi:hypothetical protein
MNLSVIAFSLLTSLLLGMAFDIQSVNVQFQPVFLHFFAGGGLQLTHTNRLSIASISAAVAVATRNRESAKGKRELEFGINELCWFLLRREIKWTT